MNFFEKNSKTIITAIISIIGGVTMILGKPIDQGTVGDLTKNLDSLFSILNDAFGVVMVIYGIIMGILRKFTDKPLVGWISK